MWFPFISIFVLVTALFAIALVAIVRSQLAWEDEQSHLFPEEQRRIKRSNYRIIVGTLIAVYAFFLGISGYLFFVLRDLGVF